MTSLTEFAHALLESKPLIPQGLKAWNNSDPAIRFAVYKNNVFVSLVDALADTYPVVKALVGEAFFHGMAQVYLQLEPPKSPIMAFYGDTFADFIAKFPPASSVPYLADVAKLEIARIYSYHATDKQVLSIDIIAAALNQPERLSNLRFDFSPSLFVISSQFAIVSLWAAHQGIGDLSQIDIATEETALVIRKGLEVETFLIGTDTGIFIRHLLQGQTLETAASLTFSTNPDFNLSHALSLLIQTQALTELHFH